MFAVLVFFSVLRLIFWRLERLLDAMYLSEILLFGRFLLESNHDIFFMVKIVPLELRSDAAFNMPVSFTSNCSYMTNKSEWTTFIYRLVMLHKRVNPELCLDQVNWTCSFYFLFFKHWGWHRLNRTWAFHWLGWKCQPVPNMVKRGSLNHKVAARLGLVSQWDQWCLG